MPEAAPRPQLTAFQRFWATDLARNEFLDCLAIEDLASLRLACRGTAIPASRFLFKNLHIHFKSTSFTRPARMAALERIGHHVRNLTFEFPHSGATFLPPLLDPVTGQEQTFIYVPQARQARPSSASERSSGASKYGSLEMADLLVQQYPPLFHAATDIASFLRTFKAMPKIRHLTISCDNQESAMRYRRSIVDYALISLRMAVEQAPLHALESLSLLPIHPGATLYLRPSLGFGSSPAAAKRWSQIRKVNIHMECFTDETSEAVDHLKMLHSYLQSFPNMSKFYFRWKGFKGPFPLSLPTESGLVSLPTAKSPTANPKRSSMTLRSLSFKSLKYLEIEHATLDASQISSFIMEHRHSLREFDFEDVVLRTGTWDLALAPLSKISGNDDWMQKQEEIMEVPIMLSPTDAPRGLLARKVLWEEEKRKHRLKNLGAYGSLQRARSKAKERLWHGEEHMKKFLRSSVLTWR